MVLWARLIGGTGFPPSPKQGAAGRPERLLAEFKHSFHQLLETWRRSSSSLSNPATADSVRLELERLTAILQDESASSRSHGCIAFALVSHLPSVASKIALASNREEVIGAAISLFNVLVELEVDEGFLGDDEFARSVLALVKGVARVNGDRAGSGLLDDAVELLFGVATKIRMQPDILPAWFELRMASQPNAKEPEDLDAEKDHTITSATYERTFPLLYALLAYVHYEGPIGDFARTGLLYIIESSSSFQALEHWIVECDLATLMASGLGALYSQLSRKLIVSFPNEELPAILALSDYSAPATGPDVQKSTSPEFQSHMDTFLSYLMFWQDVLAHCKSAELKRTLLDHFRVLFLQQVLYPSVLESSDFDGGSSVAVLTYLRRILESLNHPDLTDLVLHYLLGLPEKEQHGSASGSDMRRAMKRRKTLDLLVQGKKGEEKPSPRLFNLVDLINASMLSPNPQTVASTLQLVATLLGRHHPYAISKVLRISPVSSVSSGRTIGAHHKEVDILLSLAAAISNEDGADESYESYLIDNLNTLQSHSCFGRILSGRGNETLKLSSMTPSLADNLSQIPAHLLKLDDPFLKSVMRLLETFLENSTEINLCLTGVVVALASCPYTKLEGWIFVDPSKYDYHSCNDVIQKSGIQTSEENDTAISSAIPGSEGQPESAILEAMRGAQRIPGWSAAHTPPLIGIVQNLVDQTKGYRSDVSDLDKLLADRKRAFQLSEKLDESLSYTPLPTVATPSKQSSEPISPMPGEKLSSIGSISRRLFGNSPSNASSRSSSPHGRQKVLTPLTLRSSESAHQDSPSPSMVSKRSLSSSPLRDVPPPSPSPPGSRLSAYDVGSLRRQVITKQKALSPLDDVVASQPSSHVVADYEVTGQQPKLKTASGYITVSHLLTNAIILQEFIFELAALIQVRASLFEDVKFS